MKKRFSLYSLAEREQRDVKAGYEVGFRLCLCGCIWADCGGSSHNANECANWEEGKISPSLEPHDAG